MFHLNIVLCDGLCDMCKMKTIFPTKRHYAIWCCKKQYSQYILPFQNPVFLQSTSLSRFLCPSRPSTFQAAHETNRTTYRTNARNNYKIKNLTFYFFICILRRRAIIAMKPSLIDQIECQRLPSIKTQINLAARCRLEGAIFFVGGGRCSSGTVLHLHVIILAAMKMMHT